MALGGADKVNQMINTILLIVVAILLGCGTTHRDGRNAELTEAQALQLAVSLANAECTDKFGEAPFEALNFPIRFQEGGWLWGDFDIRGVYGFSAVVSFDSRGEDRKTLVFFSHDRPKPVRQNDDR
jgi:hypothetical protein